MYIHTLAVEGAAPSVFMIWLRACFRLEQRRKKPLGRPRYRRKNNIKIVLKMEEEGMDFINLIEDRVQWRVVVDTAIVVVDSAMNISFP
jgi:hypothetical protein